MWRSSSLKHRACFVFRLGLHCLSVAAFLRVAASPVLAQSGGVAQEVSSRDYHPEFELQAERNLVLVRVVVRDGKGVPVSNLTKNDFEVFDRGRLQPITEFSVEKPAEPGEASTPNPSASGQPAAATAALPHLRFLALYFDDLHTDAEGLERVRNAADHYLGASTLADDRVGLFTSSGEGQLDFTDNRAALHRALFALRPHPVKDPGKTCADITPYQAYLIFVQQTGNPIPADALPDPLAIATQEIQISCLGQPDPNDPGGTAAMAHMANQLAVTQAIEEHNFDEQESRETLRGVDAVIRRMSILPGQRSVVVVSSGFLTLTLKYDLDQLVERALRANVTLNALDARGLYTDTAIADTRTSATAELPADLLWNKERLLKPAAVLDSEAQATMASDTGGVFFENNNDFVAGLRETATFPEAYYVLGFSPQNLKFDGTFHALKVRLIAKPALTLQARRGYYAPPNPEDPAVRAKEDIREALFSENQIMDLPVEVRTQFFVKSASSAQLDVLAHLDVHQVHFRKQPDRSVDNLTCTTALFDREGHLVTVLEKVVDLNLRDATLASLLRSGMTLRTRFDVKSGTYLVRTVVRDSASGRLSSLSSTVQIPD